MRITEIDSPIQTVLRNKKFVGDFEVTIYHPDMADVKIKGYKQNESAYPYNFACELRNKINEICFLIVSGVISDGNFSFDIKGRIEYVYEMDENSETLKY
jgi:hypothetical protein